MKGLVSFHNKPARQCLQTEKTTYHFEIAFVLIILFIQEETWTGIIGAVEEEIHVEMELDSLHELYY